MADARNDLRPVPLDGLACAAPVAALATGEVDLQIVGRQGVRTRQRAEGSRPHGRRPVREEAPRGSDVAQVAADEDVPFVAVPFGTRNHFARDAGYDREDPLAALPAFTEGVERRVDIGVVCGRLFLNNVSLGVYAAFVHDEAQRTKNRMLAGLRMVPAVFGRSRRPLDLSFAVDGRRDDVSQRASAP